MVEVSHLAGVAGFLPRPPAFDRFLDLDGLNTRVLDLLAHNPQTLVCRELGRSREGRPLLELRIGNGPRHALWYAGPHSNEPVGGNTIVYLAELLLNEAPMPGIEEWTFHLVPCVDPDALALNQGWLTEQLSVEGYYRHLYRPAENEWPDWDMPIAHGPLRRDSFLPEGRALRALIDEVRPEFLYALHNGEVGGAFCYLAGSPASALSLSSWLSELGLPIAGVPIEDPTVEVLAPGVFGLPNMTVAYDELIRSGHPDPSALLRRGESAPHYAHARGAVALLTEAPYWTYRPIGASEKHSTLAGSVQESTSHLRRFSEWFNDLLADIEPALTYNGPLRRSVFDGPAFLSRLCAGLELAASSPALQRSADASQIAENHFTAVVSIPQRYRGMLLRLLDQELVVDARAPLATARARVLKEFDQVGKTLLPDVLEQHDVNLLVTAQTGAGLLVQLAMSAEGQT